MKDADPADPLASPAAQASFVAAMHTPSAYAALHAVDEPVRCIETHVSWVFLTGEFAYKVKKPLRLSFLDYSSAERREAFCREELRLNRRHAPGLYLETVPIAGTPAAPRVGDRSGHAFEHALRMLQFDPRLELTHLLQAGDVTTPEIDALAADIARMHGLATRAAPGSDFGSIATLRRIAHDNFDELGRLLQAREDAARLSALRSALDAEFAATSPLLDARRRDGRVRECHGDLHGGNIVRWRGRLVAFDGLEFDPALRFIDVANDTAFLSMDLAAHGRADLRRALLDAWTSATGDYEAVETLRYYETCRALVRAKVAALRDRQAPGDATGAASLAHRYLEWAVARPAPRTPWLVVMAGLSGSGKTWLARRIAASVGALQLRSDVERKRLAGLDALDPSGSAPDAGIYTMDFNRRTYARLRDCASHCLRAGQHVVVDAASLRRDERAEFARLAGELGAGLRLVHCHAPLEVLRERVATRRASADDASEATVELLDRQPSYWEALSPTEQAVTLPVDTRNPDEVDATLRELAGLASGY